MFSFDPSLIIMQILIRMMIFERLVPKGCMNCFVVLEGREMRCGEWGVMGKGGESCWWHVGGRGEVS